MTNPGSTTFFSFRPTKGGFADQLQELGVFYKLGSDLGFVYVHRPLQTARSTRPHGVVAHVLRRVFWPIRGLAGRLAPEAFFDVHDFLGINEFLERAHPAPVGRKLERVEIFLSDEILRGRGVTTFEGLRNYVTEAVECSPHHGRSDLLVEFSLRRYVDWFGLVLREPCDPEARLDLSTAYRDARRRRPWPSSFRPDALKVLVHIRQGDTAFIETPWGSYVSIWGHVSNRMTECRTLDEIDTDRIILESDYFALLEAIYSAFGEGAVSSLVFSDGYARAFQILRKGLRNRRLQWTLEQRAAIDRQARSYEDDRFRCFEELGSCATVIGETRRNLCDLIEALMQCSVVVVGTHGELVQKLVAAYFDLHTMPIVIVLFRRRRPDYQTIGLGEKHEKFVYVDVENPDVGPVIERLRAISDA